MKKIVLAVTAVLFTFMVVNAQTKTTPTITTTTTPPVTTPPTPKQDNPNGPVISFDSIVHDFGKVIKKTDPISCEFKFVNTGKEPLIITDTKSTCGCTIPKWPKEPILPGKSGVIQVSYSKTSNLGPINKQITVFSNANNGNVVLSIKGTVIEDPNAPKTPPATQTPPTTPVKPATTTPQK